jgi:hypothetical protein
LIPGTTTDIKGHMVIRWQLIIHRWEKSKDTM